MPIVSKTSKQRRVEHMVRQDVLRYYRDRALSETRLTSEGFAEAMAVAYAEQVPEHARALDLSLPDERTAPYRDMARAVGRIEKRIKRYVDGDLHLPAELEEPWVAALPSPYREDCTHDLARRYGLLGAVALEARPCPDAEAVSRILTEVGDLTRTLGSALADGELTADDFDGSGRILRDLDDAAAAIASVRARVVEVCGDRVVVPPQWKSQARTPK